MSKNEWKKWLGVVGRVLLAYALIFSQSALARQNPKATDKANAPKQTSALEKERRAPGGPNEGIKVHGHWMIEVRNPDGSVATHREFENSLDPNGGAQFLASVLSRQSIVGHWSITLSNNGTLALNPCISGGPAPCLTFEASSGSGAVVNSSFATLIISVGTNGSLILSGTIVVAQNGAIDSVASGVNTCGPTATPATCNFASGPPFPITNGYSFTSAFVNPAVNVSFGQTVAVTVTFTFA